jgi:transcriptional regulator NrdR family protein
MFRTEYTSYKEDKMFTSMRKRLDKQPLLDRKLNNLIQSIISAYQFLDIQGICIGL